jgi:hypothetical protein
MILQTWGIPSLQPNVWNARFQGQPEVPNRRCKNVRLAASNPQPGSSASKRLIERIYGSETCLAGPILQHSALWWGN